MGLIIASLAPVFVILFYIYFRDKYEKEPVYLLLLSLGSGVLIVLPVLGVETLLDLLRPSLGQVGTAFYDAFIVAASTEEGFKFLALFLLIWRRPAFNEQFDGIVYAVFVSLGFAAVENVMYVLDGGYENALIRAITAVPAHALFGICMGYNLGIARRYEELRSAYIIRGILFPVLYHGLYNFILMVNVGWLLILFIPYVIFLFITGFKKMKVLSAASVFRDREDETQ